MSATGSTPLDTLPPESKAMLSLVLVQGRSFQEIADMLHMSPVDVRARAHAAAQALMGDPGDSPSPAGRARIIDYLLGEQSVSERELTRSELTSLDASRAWAKRLATSLSPLAKDPLPSIPGSEPAPPGAPAPAPPEAPASPEPQPEARSAVAPTPAPGPAPAPPRTQREPVVPPPPRPAEPRSYRPGRGLLAAIAIAVVVAVVVVIVIASGGSSSPRTAASAPSASSPTTGTAPADTGSGKTVRRLVLVGTGSSNKAFGAGAVISHHGRLLLLLQARGLTPNHRNFYGVWLYNTPGDARLLGFVSPPVGAAGTFSSSVPLPDDAVRFHSLIVTLERTDLPQSHPGPTVLRSPLSLP